jgi:hypothetical protein
MAELLEQRRRGLYARVARGIEYGRATGHSIDNPMRRRRLSAATAANGRAGGGAV